MKKSLIYIIFLASFFLQNNSSAEESINTKELYKVTTKDNKVTAIWIGEDQTIDSSLKDMPLTFGVQKLVFEFSATKERIEFKPQGELFFSSWSFNIFSPDFRFVVLLQDHYGPYHIIPIDNLRDYLSGKNTQFEIVDGRIPDGSGAIHGEILWLTDDSIKFSACCCGGCYLVKHKFGEKTQYGKWKRGEGNLK